MSITAFVIVYGSLICYILNSIWYCYCSGVSRAADEYPHVSISVGRYFSPFLSVLVFTSVSFKVGVSGPL